MDAPVAEEPNETVSPNSQEKVPVEPLDPVLSQTQGIPPEHGEETVVPDLTAKVPALEETVPPVSSELFEFWKDLPNAEDLPQETEKFFDEEEQEKTNLLSTFLFFAAGVLLFSSVVAASILFRNEDKKGKKTKKS